MTFLEEFLLKPTTARHQCSWCLGPSHVFFCAFFAWPLDNTPPTLTTVQWFDVDVDSVCHKALEENFILVLIICFMSYH